MLNTNNKVNYEINVKQEEKKYSWSTVFAWLYLKTIGRVLPKKWNKWAENILYYDKATVGNGIQTDGLTTVDESVQIDLKPEVAIKESQSEVIGEDKEVQTEENSEFNDGFIDEDYDSMEEVSTEEDVSQELELERLQNASLKKTNEDLESIIERLEKDCKKLVKDADKQEKKLISVKEKDMKINSLTSSNEALEQDKKEMEAKNNEQQRTISDQEKRIKEQDALIKSLTGKNKDISEAVKKDNEGLRIQITELESKVSELKGESDTKAANIKQLEDKLSELRQQKQAELEQAKEKNAEVEDFRKRLQSAQESKQKLEKEKTDLESKLKDLNSQLSTTVKEKKDLENEVARLQEQVWRLEGSKEWELAGIDDSLKKVFLDVIGMLEKELLINNQEQQPQGKKIDLIERLKAELKKESDEELQETREKIAEQEKLIEQLQKKQKQVEDQLKADVKRPQEEKENMEEQLKIMQQQLLNNQERQKLEEKLKDVDERLEDIDGETQKSQEQTKAKEPDAVSLVGTVSTAKSSQSRLLKAQHFVGKLLLKNKNPDNFLSKKNEELKKSFPEFEKQHFCHNVLNKTIESLLNQDDGKFESSKLLELLENNLKKSAEDIIKDKVKKLDPGKNKEIFIKESAETRMQIFSDKIQELQLASSIRDKLLSPDQGMCNQTQGGVNEYQLTEKAKKEYTPNSSMSYTNTVSIHLSNHQKIVRAGS